MVLRLLLICVLSLFSPLSGLLDTLTVSGNPNPFVFATPAAGSQPANIVDTSTTYAVLSLLSAKKITGQLSANMPTGMTLSVQLQAPLVGTSQGNVLLSTTAADLVTGILLVALQSGLQITYTMTASLQASPVTGGTVVVTYTLI